MTNWRDDAKPDRDGLSLGDLDDGDSIEVTALDDGEKRVTHPRGEETEALFVGVQVHSYPDGYTDMNGNEIAEDGEYNLITSSRRLWYALAELAEDLSGERFTITAVGESRDMNNRTYRVE